MMCAGRATHRAHDGRLPVKEIISVRASTTVGRWVPVDIGQLLRERGLRKTVPEISLPKRRAHSLLRPTFTD